MKILAQLEDASPGTRHAILRGHDSMRGALRASFKPAALTRCAKCGEPGMSSTCKACEMVALLAGKSGKAKKARSRKRAR